MYICYHVFGFGVAMLLLLIATTNSLPVGSFVMFKVQSDDIHCVFVLDKYSAICNMKFYITLFNLKEKMIKLAGKLKNHLVSLPHFKE